jgi:hypothetical protein
MKKKQLIFSDNSTSFTYFNNRKCVYCEKPIEDQARPNKIHCSPRTDENGVKHDCKRRKHSFNHGHEDEILQAHNAKAKDLNKKIMKLLTDQGNLVTTHELNAYGIILNDGITFTFDGHTLTTQFIDYTIVSNPIANSHEIQINRN